MWWAGLARSKCVYVYAFGQHTSGVMPSLSAQLTRREAHESQHEAPTRRGKIRQGRFFFQTCLALKRAFQPGTKYVFSNIFGGKRAVPGTVPMHTLGSTSQQESCDESVPSVLVPGTLLWTYSWAFLGHRGGEKGGAWYGTSAKPEGHFTKGMKIRQGTGRELLSAIAHVSLGSQPLRLLELPRHRDEHPRLLRVHAHIYTKHSSQFALYFALGWPAEPRR